MLIFEWDSVQCGTIGATRAAVLVWLGLGLAFGSPVEAQSTGGGFVTTPLDPLDPVDPTDPVDPVQGVPSFSGTIQPESGFQQTPLANPDSGFVENSANVDGAFIQLNPGGQDGVALVQTRNTRAASSVSAAAAETAPGAVLRMLDKTRGQTMDFDLATGETVVVGRLAVRLHECRFPVDNPASDAFADLEIADLEGRALFSGWMVASSPTLMALEHPRYDVWVLNCSTS
ncbi:MAG: DUF2155 domain-containing protein [Pseudomonadota bacterium]